MKKVRCYRCGQEVHISSDENFPAHQTVCIKCVKVVHYAAMCKTKTDSGEASGNKVRGRKRSPQCTKSVEEVVVDDADDDEVLGLFTADVPGNTKMAQSQCSANYKMVQSQCSAKPDQFPMHYAKRLKKN